MLGFTGFGVNAALNSRVFGIPPGTPTLAAAGSTAAFNVGITVGPWLGGLALTAGYGYPAIPWISAALASVVLALLVVEVAARPHRGAQQEAPSTVALVRGPLISRACARFHAVDGAAGLRLAPYRRGHQPSGGTFSPAARVSARRPDAT
ncbi:hypothetical protein [Saccharopolyspora endophytica]|uniref:MFS transporter n=1 Tax=Saccharopolyspora endophytica TaxID=543886 RepID=A0ABS5DHA8_9PSEU|nr:hypothetical protein [Saccharopolyspora endophytica]MBQ0925671.1 hypothetical protein [Saccharopolyspora endophytica]